MNSKHQALARMTIVRRLAAGTLLTALMLLSASPLPAAGRDELNLEQAVKAALIFNFAKFVEWPDEALGRQDELVIGVAGDAELGEILEQSAEGKVIRGMRVRVEPAVTDVSAAQCHILYIGAAMEKESEKLLAALGNRPVLTVGTEPEFLDRGGVIRFIQAGSKIRFEINLGKAWDNRLHISSKLLQLADVVQRDERSGR